TVKIDTTPPTVAGAADRAPNANGWYNGDVTVHFTATDALSGLLANPADTTLFEGAEQTASATVYDLAGNSASATVSGLNIDETTPTLALGLSGPQGGNGWYTGPVTVSPSAQDALSGLAAQSA